MSLGILMCGVLRVRRKERHSIIIRHNNLRIVVIYRLTELIFWRQCIEPGFFRKGLFRVRTKKGVLFDRR